ncbi:GNAT family N-acetyltransferase [Prauserella alba]|uniref:GNAT family N-acetyltransferase n=1 Tax=Prauserella alba TaxID=176898 RepID=A0ABP4G4N2_9PSEU|nr:GNAT family N-acetyltransferase [Prauserella alba]MCP2179247.1 Acetyltransferase (GNAT) family protein [Prauserella alba]
MTQVNLPVSVRALTAGDLPRCEWAGSSTHLDYVRRALVRAEHGEVAYLAVCPPSDLPVAIGGVDFAAKAGVGTVWQLVVHPALRSCGLGTHLVRACETAVTERGLPQAELSVEHGNVRAHRWYRRLGYVDVGERTEEWDVETADSATARHRTVCTVMRKDL